VEGKYPFTQSRLLRYGGQDEAHDPNMGQAPADGKLAEVLVDRHEDVTLSMRRLEDRSIAGVTRPLANPGDIVTGPAQILDGL